MSTKLLTEMTFDEGKGLIENFIEYSSHQNDDLPAEAFFELFFAKTVPTIASNESAPSSRKGQLSPVGE